MEAHVETLPIIGVNDIIETRIDSLINNTDKAVSNVVINVTVPSGVIFDGVSVAKGNYNSVSKQWTIDFLASGEEVDAVFYWKVTDDCLAPFKFWFSSGTPNVCVDTTQTACIIIDGLTDCRLTKFSPIRTVFSSITVTIHDETLVVDASGGAVTLTLPPPSSVYSVDRQAGTIWYFKCIDLSNPVIINSPDGKIIDMSNLMDAGNQLEFSTVGSTFMIQSNKTYYIVKSVI